MSILTDFFTVWKLRVRAFYRLKRELLRTSASNVMAILSSGPKSNRLEKNPTILQKSLILKKINNFDENHKLSPFNSLAGPPTFRRGIFINSKTWPKNTYFPHFCFAESNARVELSRFRTLFTPFAPPTKGVKVDVEIFRNLGIDLNFLIVTLGLNFFWM